MDDPVTRRIIEALAGSIDIPDSAYEKAERRYKDLGDWFERSESSCAQFAPHIHPQGSFRLGTVVRPLNEQDEYDLDLSCRLRSGITRLTHSQKQLKDLVRRDLEAYRLARGIKEEVEGKPRCWRLSYADTLRFHMDAVPSIPDSPEPREVFMERMIKAGTSPSLAQEVAKLAGSITDNRRWNYSIINDDWLVSNPEGYAQWFVNQMKLAKVLLEKRARDVSKAKVDELPVYQWKSPLQRCVQILKRHRDVMFSKEVDSQPISIIITTLAAEAYQGEADVPSALMGIVSRLKGLVSPTVPRVPNPVNPVEDFADKWGEQRYSHLRLEQSFWRWVERAESDLRQIGSARDVQVIVKEASGKFSSVLEPAVVRAMLGAKSSDALLKPAVEPPAPDFPPSQVRPRKPNGFA